MNKNVVKLYKFDRGQLEYKVVGSGNEVILLLPPGLGEINHFDNLINSLKDKYRFLTLNYPGVGDSDIKNPDLRSIAKTISELICYLKIDYIYIYITIGESYGGSLGIYLLDYIKIKKIFFVSSGEYFSLWQKVLLKLLFLPPFLFSVFRKPYMEILKKIPIKEVPDFKGDPNLDLGIIVKRWWNILDYRVPNKTFSIPATIFVGKHDYILRRGSVSKLSKTFPNNLIINIKSDHGGIMETLLADNCKLIYGYIKSNRI